MHMYIYMCVRGSPHAWLNGLCCCALCLYFFLDSIRKSSSGCKTATTKCGRIGGGCGFCWLCGIAARGAPSVILVTICRFYMWLLILVFSKLFPYDCFIFSCTFWAFWYFIAWLWCHKLFWDFALPQLKRLKLRKNNWDSDTYEFDEVLTEFASQKRVYEVVAKPVVEVCYFLVPTLIVRGTSLL